MFQFWFDFVNNLLRKENSATVAAGRLKGRVFLDRLNLSPATLDRIRTDVLNSISRYLVIDEGAMTLAVQAEGRIVALAASIPVLKARDNARAELSTETDRPSPPQQSVSAAVPTTTVPVALPSSASAPAHAEGTRQARSPEKSRQRSRARALRRRKHRRRVAAQV